MASKASQRAVYLVTGLIVASMIGGFALASLSLGGAPSTSYQGGQTTNVTPIPGLTWVSTNLTAVPTTGNGSTFSVCSHLAPCDLTTAGFAVCAGGFTGSTGCAASDFVEQVNLSVSRTVPLPGTVSLTLYVTGAPVGGSASTIRGLTFYFVETTSTPEPTGIEFVLLDFDIGTVLTGPGSVSTVSVLGTT